MQAIYILIIAGAIFMAARCIGALISEKKADRLLSLVTVVFLIGSLYFLVIKQPTMNDTITFMENKNVIQLNFRE